MRDSTVSRPAVAEGIDAMEWTAEGVRETSAPLGGLRSASCLWQGTQAVVRSELCTAAAVVDSMVTEVTEGEEGGLIKDVTGTRETEGG